MSDGYDFIADPAELIDIDDEFDETYLLERLTGIGIPREDP